MAAPVLNLFDYEQLAQETLPPDKVHRIEARVPRRSMDERSRHVFNAITLRPRVMSDVSTCVTARDVAGSRVRLPVLGGASALDAANSAAQVDIAQAAARAGTVQLVSSTWPRISTRWRLTNRSGYRCRSSSATAP